MQSAIRLAKVFRSVLAQQEQVRAENVVKDWEYSNPAQYVVSLVEVFGEPIFITAKGDGEAVWKNIAGFDYVVVRDEEISHDFPTDHLDFVYSSLQINVPPELYTSFANVTGSIILDGLKQQATARCGSLIANAITLGFIQDVLDDKAEPTKEEYKARIMEHQIPDWYKDEMGEK